LLAAAQHFPERGITGTLNIDLAKAWAHQKQVVRTVQASYLDYLKRLKVRAIHGTARFADARRLVVDTSVGAQDISATHIVIATGTCPSLPAGVTLTPDKVITTDQLFDVPPPAGQRVAILGAGAVATEFAFILRTFGKDVLWLTRRPALAASRYSLQALAILRQALEAAGVAPRTGSDVLGVHADAQGVRLVLKDGEERVDWVLAATGRQPLGDTLGMAAAGIATTSQGFIATNDFLQTTLPHVYAIGDGVGPVLTANQALADASVAVANIIDGPRQRRDLNRVPEVVYSAVELARVGLNEAEAEAQDLEPAVGFAAFETSPSALDQGDARGFVRLIGDLESGALLGGEVVGGDADELIQLLSVAPDPKTALRWLARARYNHPSRSEEFLNATETLAMKWGLGAVIFGET